MISLKKNKRGFTIVELLIVIVVIGILALLVITTYSGITQKARDAERKTDINALQSQLEAYYATNNKYPTLANFNDSTWRSTNLKGLDSAALADPKNPGSQQVCASVSAGCYAYVVTPANCDNSTNDCTTYTLTATLETNGTYVKQSLN